MEYVHQLKNLIKIITYSRKLKKFKIRQNSKEDKITEEFTIYDFNHLQLSVVD